METNYQTNKYFRSLFKTSCIIPSCRQKTCDGVSLHTFPNIVVDRDRAKKWEDILDLKNLKINITKHSRICSSHFDSHSFYPQSEYSTTNKLKLRPDALPRTIHIEEPSKGISTSTPATVIDPEFFCGICMEVKKNYYLTTEIHDGQTIEDIIEFTTGLKWHQTPFKRICTDCHFRMNLAYRFKKDCNDVYLIINEGVSDAHKQEEIKLNSIENIEDLFNFEESRIENISETSGSVNFGINGEYDFKAELDYISSKRRQFSCYVCDIKFDRLDEKYKHYENVHHGNSLYKCFTCQKSFETKQTFSKHDFYSHQIIKTDKLLICETCGLNFKSPKTLNVHKLTHKSHEEKEKLKNFICDKCPKKFYQKFGLDHHKRTHNTECIFKCPACKKAYRTQITLKLHMMNVHQTIDPKFSCNTCGEKFLLENRYRRHIEFCKNGTDDEMKEDYLVDEDFIND